MPADLQHLLPMATREPHHGVLLIAWLSPEKMSVTTAFQNRAVVGEGFEPSKVVPADLAQSAPLATREPHHGVLLIVWLSPEKMSVATASQNRWWWGKDFLRTFEGAVPADLQSAPLLATRETPPRGIAYCLAFARKDVSDNSFSNNKWWWGEGFELFEG